MTASQFLTIASIRNAFARNWYFKQKPQLFDILSPATFLSNLGQVLISQYLINNNKVIEFKELLRDMQDDFIVENKLVELQQ